MAVGQGKIVLTLSELYDHITGTSTNVGTLQPYQVICLISFSIAKKCVCRI